MGFPVITPNIPADALSSGKAQNAGDPFFRIQYSIMETIFSSSLNSRMQFLFSFSLSPSEQSKEMIWKLDITARSAGQKQKWPHLQHHSAFVYLMTSLAILLLWQ